MMQHSKSRSSALDTPPSFCDMGNAISSLIAETSGGGQGDGEECVLLSEEHSLVLTCCWVTLKVTHTHEQTSKRAGRRQQTDSSSQHAFAVVFSF